MNFQFMKIMANESSEELIKQIVYINPQVIQFVS